MLGGGHGALAGSHTDPGGGCPRCWGPLDEGPVPVTVPPSPGCAPPPAPPPPQACIDENMEVVQFLVESGADVNQADNEGWTPLHVAASCGYRHIAQ